MSDLDQNSFDGIYEDNGSDGSYCSDQDYTNTNTNTNNNDAPPPRPSPRIVHYDCSPCSLRSNESHHGFDAFEQHDAQMTQEVGRLLIELDEKMYDQDVRRHENNDTDTVGNGTHSPKQTTDTKEEDSHTSATADPAPLDALTRNNLMRRHHFEINNPHRNATPQVSEWTRRFPHFRICGVATGPSAVPSMQSGAGDTQQQQQQHDTVLAMSKPLVYRPADGRTTPTTMPTTHSTSSSLAIVGQGTTRTEHVEEEILASHGEYTECIVCDTNPPPPPSTIATTTTTAPPVAPPSKEDTDIVEQRNRHARAGIPPIDPALSMRHALMSEVFDPLWFQISTLLLPLFRTIYKQLWVVQKNQEQEEARQKQQEQQEQQEHLSNNRNRRPASGSGQFNLSPKEHQHHRTTATKQFHHNKDVRLGLAMTITSLNAQGGASSLSARSSRSDTATRVAKHEDGSIRGSRNSRWVLDNTPQEECHRVNIGMESNGDVGGRRGGTRLNRGSRTSRRGHTGLVGRTLQPSGQHEGAPLASFGAGGYRMQRPPNNSSNTVVGGHNGSGGGGHGSTGIERERYHHKGSFFQRQGSATMRSSSSYTHQKGNLGSTTSSWAGGRIPSQATGRRGGGRGSGGGGDGGGTSDRPIAGNNVVGKEFQLPYLLGPTNGESSPVRVRTALPTVGGDRNDDTSLNSFVYRSQLPKLRGGGGSEFLTTAGLISGGGVEGSGTKWNDR